jgi:hypothetical protein
MAHKDNPQWLGLEFMVIFSWSDLPEHLYIHREDVYNSQAQAPDTRWKYLSDTITDAPWTSTLPVTSKIVATVEEKFIRKAHKRYSWNRASSL